MGAQKETLGFQAEVKQLLHLMIHSLYSNKEIFLRELVSNASDACDRLRFEAIARPELLPAGTELAIRVAFDKDARTVTVSDNGIGMTRAEAVAHLGTIARSGTQEFFAALTGDQKKDAQLIGQFGVGFYSSFIVADRVTVISRRAGPDEAVRWESDGTGEFSVEANPADVTASLVETLEAYGGNRVSLGGQSFDEAKLRLLERDHSADQLRRAFDLVRGRIRSVAVDLIFGTPGETLATWQADLAHLTALRPDHVSTYGLTFERGTAFWGRLAKGQLARLDEELEREQYAAAIDVLSAAGFAH